ncbi:bridging integrator 3 isoform X1 [Nematostella vectensis]|uniref:bridging integrator 3 isoform X1 n=1 Tax=Nematostella vectensis TaxID=45351 RepID=UPI002076EC52|nr:bridging integrator 3 isoform X1 [Nematostella vectensis]
MSWINPFNKLIAPNKARQTGKQADNDFEKECARFYQFESATKKVYKGMKRYGEAMLALNKAEQRIFQDLASGPLAQTDLLQEPVDEFSKVTAKLDELRQELVSRNQKIFLDPMKRLRSVFPSVNDAIRAREQSFMEYAKHQAKVEKLAEKERTPQNLAKLEQAEKDLAKAKADYERQNAVMLEDLPMLTNGRVDYFEPCFEALILSEASYYSQSAQALTNLTNLLSRSSEQLNIEEQQAQLERKLADLKALSITEDV